MYFSAEFNFTKYVFICILLHIKETEVMNSSKELYSVLKFTDVCHVIVLLLAVLQWH